MNEPAKKRKGKSLKEYFERWLDKNLQTGKRNLDVTNADFEFNDNHENRFIKCLKCDKELPVTLDSHGSFKITSVVRHLEKDHTSTTTASITTATASSNQRDSVAETSGQEQNLITTATASSNQRRYYQHV